MIAMGRISSDQILKQLSHTAVFDLKTVCRIAGKKPAYARLLAFRLAKAGKIHAIARGRYCVTEDPVAVASNLVHPSYLSLWSAFRFYGLTEQLPGDMFVVSNRQRRPVPFMGSKIVFVHQKRLLPFARKTYGNFEIFVAEPETAIVESLRHPSYVPLGETVKALASGKLDLGKLGQVAKQAGICVQKRVGFILERLGEPAFPPPKSTNMARLDALRPPRGRRDSKWMVINNNEAVFDDIEHGA